MAASSPPRIPYIGAYLNDLTFINEMRTKSATDKNKYNFRKLTLVGAAIERIFTSHEVLYWYHVVPELKRWIEANEASRLATDALFARSLEVQPRSAQ